MIENLRSAIGSLGPALANHLWQSTAFAFVICLLALRFRKNRAQVRYGLWLAASLKFLFPFSLLIGLGGVLPQCHSPLAPLQPVLSSAVGVASQPFADWGDIPSGVSVQSMPERTLAWLLPALFLIWLCGMLIVTLIWCAHWRKASSVLRRSTPAESGRELEILRRVERRAYLGSPTQLRFSDDLMEPGIFGIFHPVLLWPRKLSAQMDEEHLEGILIHEVMHVRRRDNLTATLHMAVEAIFWFHPLIWWIERQLMIERERACDEAVVQSGSQAEIYAESLLKVSRFCAEPPLQCVSGITGATLTTRIRGIMTPHFRELGVSRKITLFSLAAFTLVVPIAFGLLQTKVIKFDVVSIHPVQHGLPGIGMTLDPTPDGYRSTLTLWQMVMIAYAPGDNNSWRTTRIVNAPKLLSDPQWYLINARVSDEDVEAWSHQSSKHELLRSAMQALLKDRCKLVIHQVPATILDYKLVPAKHGPYLKPSVPGATLPKGGPLPSGGVRVFERLPGGVTRWHYYGATMGDLADFLSMSTQQRPVHDATGLTGRYDFTFQSIDRPSSDPDEAVYNWPVDQLGLELKRGTSAGYALVIDHIEKPALN